MFPVILLDPREPVLAQDERKTCKKKAAYVCSVAEEGKSKVSLPSTSRRPWAIWFVMGRTGWRVGCGQLGIPIFSSLFPESMVLSE